MRKKLLILFSIMLMISVISAVFISLTGTKPKEKEEKLTIVTSFYPIYVAAGNIVSDMDNIELINLAENQTGCLHDYQLTTKDMKKLENADIFIINGGGIEGFATDIVKNYPDITIVDSSTGIEFLPSMEEHGHSHEEENSISEEQYIEEEHEKEEHEKEEHEEEDHEEEEHTKDEDHDHEHGELNPHIWLDPDNYIRQVENIKNGLAKYDKSHEEEYNENAAVYEEKIKQIKEELVTELRDPKNKDVVIFHDSFAYLAKRLGLDVVHTVNIEADTSLSAGEIKEVIEEIKLHGVKVLFSEEQYSRDIPLNIARESGAEVYVIDSLVTGDGDKDSYIRGMKKNIETLKKALYE